MNVTTWNNGKQKGSDSVYGVRISKQDRDAHFNKIWTHVEIDIPGAGTIKANLSKSFWGTCLEIRSRHIGKWLISNSLAPWPKGSPHIVKLTKIRGNKFRLHR